MSFRTLLRHSWEAYTLNVKLISFFSIPFLIALPLALLLPNFTAVSGVFLRLGSIRHDLTVANTLWIVLPFLVALLLFSFAIAAINVVVRHQRTLTRVGHADLERMESATFKLFLIFLAAFFVILLFNLWVRDLTASPLVFGSLFSLIVSLAILFAPQAVVLEERGVLHSLKSSASVILQKFYFFVLFVCFASLLLLLNSFVFLQLAKAVPEALYAGILVNSLFLLPFFEVLKTQIYLSKYSLLR